MNIVYNQDLETARVANLLSKRYTPYQVYNTFDTHVGEHIRINLILRIAKSIGVLGSQQRLTVPYRQLRRLIRAYTKDMKYPGKLKTHDILREDFGIAIPLGTKSGQNITNFLI